MHMTQGQRLVGFVAMGVAVCSWAGFALSMRGAAASTLSQADLALIRFGVPLLVLAPWLPASLRRLRRQPRAALVAIVVGAGLPHLWVSETGGGLTSAGLVGLVIPGTVPLFVALVAFVVLRESVVRGRILSLGTIGLGVVVTLLSTPAGASVAGIVALLAAGLLWSVYTVALRQASLRPLDVVVVVSLPSAVTTAALMATGLVDSRLLHGGAEGHDVLGYALALGVLTGVVSTLCYSTAVTRIGTRNASMLGALSPVLAGVAAVPLFGEWPDTAMIASLVLITAGVLASTVVRQPALVPVTSGPGPGFNVLRATSI
jgi:drug/metabolite transporter (DMT)-like permease